MAGQSNRSEAYDLALFEPKQAKIVELTPNKKLQKAERRRTRVQSAFCSFLFGVRSCKKPNGAARASSRCSTRWECCWSPPSSSGWSA